MYLFMPRLFCRSVYYVFIQNSLIDLLFFRNKQKPNPRILFVIEDKLQENSSLNVYKWFRTKGGKRISIFSF